jgi:hypothetical protein
MDSPRNFLSDSNFHLPISTIGGFALGGGFGRIGWPSGGDLRQRKTGRDFRINPNKYA